MPQALNTLALHGGQAIFSTPLQRPDWPAVDQDTADQLRELYLSRDWSFNCPTEQEFSKQYAADHDAKHGIFMANGTVTLESALTALGVRPGDEVIVPALTWMATAMAVHYVGATPVFVDVESSTLCLDPVATQAAITKKTRVIIPVHIFGSMADLEAILVIAKKHKLSVIEDCAHMQGGKWDGKGVGSWGDIGSFSFQQSKTLSSGEGGICLTNDDKLSELIFRVKHIGYDMGQKQGEAATAPPEGLICHNYRATAFQALILKKQLADLPELLKRYNKNRQIIEEQLAAAPGFRLQACGRKATLQGYYGLVFIADQEPLANIPRELLKEALDAEGLAMAATYGPVYSHMLYNMPKDSYRMPEGGCPVAEHQGTDRAFFLPHQWLQVDEEAAAKIGKMFAKVALNAQALMAAAPSA